MREIKFRAWLPVGPWNEEGTERKYEMVGPDALAFEEYAPLAELLAGCENLMQFTGLYDKNGREIFEGDILNTPDGIHSVKWGGDGWEFGEYIRSASRATNGCLLWWGTWALEVIGNIYENPGLLEVPHAKS